MWLLSLSGPVEKSRRGCSCIPSRGIPAECFQRSLRGPGELNAEDVVHNFVMHECVCPSRIRRDLSSHVATPCLCVGFVVGAGARSQGNFLCVTHISLGSSRLTGHNRPVFLRWECFSCSAAARCRHSTVELSCTHTLGIVLPPLTSILVEEGWKNG